MDWRTKVELYEQIRREYEFGAGSIIGVARKLGVHRRTVREAVRSALPARREKTERPHLKIGPAAAFIDAVLEADRKAPRKQRHTAKRIWERIHLEVPGCTAAERTVRQYVERRKQEQGLGRRETFVPQSYEFGVEVQIDWYEAHGNPRRFLAGAIRRAAFSITRSIRRRIRRNFVQHAAPWTVQPTASGYLVVDRTHDTRLRPILA